jgi:hypothetical protein
MKRDPCRMTMTSRNRNWLWVGEEWADRGKEWLVGRLVGGECVLKETWAAMARTRGRENCSHF